MAYQNRNNKPRAEILFHSELAKMGPVAVTVDGEPRYVKSKDKFAVDLTMADGTQRSYWCENEACKEFFKGQKGAAFSLVAAGRDEDAVLTYVGQAAATLPAKTANPPPKQPNAPPPQNQHQNNPPAAESVPAGQAPPPKPAETAEQAVKRAEFHIGRNRALGMIVLRAVYATVHEVESEMRKRPVPEGGDPQFAMHPLIVAELVRCYHYDCRMNDIPGAALPVGMTFARPAKPVDKAK